MTTIRRLPIFAAAMITAACASTSDGLELQRQDEGEHVAASYDSSTLTLTLADGRQFRGPYTLDAERGKVRATLEAPGGEQLRCRLLLAPRSAALDGGASGRCVLGQGIKFNVQLAPGAARREDGIAARR